MARSPDRPPRGDVDTDSLPWAPSPGSHGAPEGGIGAEQGFTEGPTSAAEAIGGGSHRPAGPTQPRRRAADAVTLADALEDAIATRPLAALGIATAAGFLAALLLRRGRQSSRAARREF
jgi:hypothetical protein